MADAQIASEGSLGLPIGGKIVPGKLTAFKDGTAKWTYYKDTNTLVSGGGDRSTFTLTKVDDKWSWSQTTSNSIENLATRESLTVDQINNSLYVTPQLQNILYGQTVNLIGGIQEAKKIDENYPTTQGVTTLPNRPIDTVGAEDNPLPTDITLIALPEQINTQISKGFGPLRYPEKIETNGQDYIKFEVFEYISQQFSDNNLLFDRRGDYKDGSTRKDNNKEIKSIGTIVLPIQPTIMDANTVTWNDSRMGILEMMGANISLGAMNSAGTDYMTNMAKKFGETIKGTEGEKVSQEVITAVQNYIAKMAVNSNTNLLSRTGGAITNPNLNLLFESPDLRNFTFNFKLTPRTEREGTIVRKIIRKFKEHMAAQRSIGNLFLETPDVFHISYIRGDDVKSKKSGIHKSLNLFKTCALRSFSVNYTPSGTYMTYNDEAGTMTSYDLTMSFTELEPVYWNDYQEGLEDDQIGY